MSYISSKVALRTGIFAASIAIVAWVIYKTRKSVVRDLPEFPEKNSATSQKDVSIAPKKKYFNDIYKIGKQLGAGAFSVAYEAHKRSDPNCKVAVKITKRKNITPDIEKTIKSEIDIMRSLDHPNIVKYICHFEEENHWFVVLELLQGGEVFDRIIKKLRYDENVARDLVVIVLQAVKYVHERNIVHRDLKLENLLLQNTNDDAAVKVADFGFAKAVLEQDATCLQTQCGSPLYVAPEIISKIPYGKPVDMWAIGIIIYILLGGYPPFQDEGKQSQLFAKIKSGKFEFDPEFWDHVSIDAKNLISGLLVVDPKKRLTVEEALAHPWIARSSADLSAVDLHVNLQRLKRFNALKRFRAAASAVIAIRKLSRNLISSPSPSPALPDERRHSASSPLTSSDSFSIDRDLTTAHPQFKRSYNTVGGVDMYHWNNDDAVDTTYAASPLMNSFVTNTSFTTTTLSSQALFSAPSSPAPVGELLRNTNPATTGAEAASPWWN